MKTATQPAKKIRDLASCGTIIMPVRDALEALHGRWKLPIIIAVSFGPKRFKQIAKEINGITDKALSKELKELELNQLITRTVHDTFPPTVEYTITEHGESLQQVIHELASWGIHHRKKIFGKLSSDTAVLANID